MAADDMPKKSKAALILALAGPKEGEDETELDGKVSLAKVIREAIESEDDEALSEALCDFMDSCGSDED